MIRWLTTGSMGPSVDLRMSRRTLNRLLWVSVVPLAILVLRAIHFAIDLHYDPRGVGLIYSDRTASLEVAFQ